MLRGSHRLGRRWWAAFVVTLLALTAGGSELVSDAGESVRAGDVIHVRGKGAFAKGTRYSFFVGGEYASWRRLDDDTAVVVVPAGVPPGERWLSFLPRLTREAAGAVGITRVRVNPEQTETVSAATATLPRRATAAVSAGLMRIEGCGLERAASVTLRQLRSDPETAFFRSTIIAGFDRPEPPLPPFSFDDVFAIQVAHGAEISAIAVSVPATWLKTIPSGLEPELYVDVEDQGSNDEVIPRIEPLGAQWTASTRELRVRLETPLRADAHQELLIYLGIRRNPTGTIEHVESRAEVSRF